MRQIEGPPDRGDADQYAVKTGRFGTDRSDGVGRAIETDWLISERRQDLLVAEQTVAIVVNDEHGFALAEPRRRDWGRSRHRWRISFGGGQPDLEAATFSRRTGNVDCAIVIASDLADRCEAEPGSGGARLLQSRGQHR
jgi:hypothetical protein